MSPLRTQSIRKKLMLVLLLTSITTLLLSAAGFAFTDWMSRRNALFDRLRAQADIIGNNSIAALTFGDTDSAADTLASLGSEADIVAAALFDRDGRPFVSYGRERNSGALPARLPPSESGRIDGDYFAVSPIILDGDRIGSILVLSDSRHWRERRLNDIVIALGVLAGSLIAAFFLSRRLQRVVSDPILRLAETTREISEGRNYRLRAQKLSEDEIGALVDDFNGMLAQIQLRDHELNRARDQLEHKVRERTRELTELTHKLEYQAYHDTLTGLANRVKLDTQLRQALAQAKRYDGGLAVLGLDLDRFKNINDTLGHAVGDKLLVQVADRISGCLRESDLVARLGGDEFCVLLPHVEQPRDAAVLAERLVAAGVDILDMSPSSIEAPGDRAVPFKGLGVPVIAVNELDRVDRALEALNEGRADLVAIARGLIADPDWPIKVREGRFDEIVTCIYCDVKCFGNLDKDIPIECTQWK